VWLKRSYVGTDDRGIGHYRTITLGLADDFADADGRAVLSYAQAQQAALRDITVGAGPLTVTQAIDDYVAFLDAAGRPTADARSRAGAHILPKLGKLEVAGLTSPTIRTWLAALADAPAFVRTKNGAARQFKAAAGDDGEALRRRRSSANRVLTILKAALNHAYDEGKVTSNDAWGRRVKPFRSVDAARIRFLTVEEAGRLIDGSEPDFRTLVEAALQTGARYGELIRLQVEDFNAANGTLHIRKSKSGRARHVVLTDEGQDFFRSVTVGRASSATMFLRSDGGAWRASHQGRRMADANKVARLDPPITFHGLRHSWASLSVMAGVPLMVVAQNLGHASTRMVEKHYGHLTPSYVTDAIRAGAPRYRPAANVEGMIEKISLRPRQLRAN